MEQHLPKPGWSIRQKPALTACILAAEEHAWGLAGQISERHRLRGGGLNHARSSPTRDVARVDCRHPRSRVGYLPRPMNCPVVACLSLNPYTAILATAP